MHGQIKGALACLASCAKHLDTRHAIFVMDDASPPEDAAELHEGVSKFPRARYERNPENLGFVRTCNRALELDSTDNDLLLLNSDTVVTEGFLEEMLAVLDASDRHGACCPRSDNASICTVPADREGPPLSSTERYATWQHIRNLLPRFSVIPTGVGFCLLLRRDLVERFGLFDEAYGRGYHEENDLCCRLSRMGYSAVLANRAFVFHKGERSFGSAEKALLQREHATLLHARYPEYEGAVREHLAYGLPAAEHFAEVLGRKGKKPRVLIDLSRMSGRRGGIPEAAMALLEHLVPMTAGRWDITIRAEPGADAAFGLSARFPVVTTDRPLPHRFDLAFVPRQPTDRRQVLELNRVALRMVFTFHDAIALRVHAIRSIDMRLAASVAARHLDGLLSVSEAALEDVRTFLGSDLPESVPARAVLHGRPAPSAPGPRSADLPAEPFVFVAGNAFPHKALKDALRVLPPDLPAVILGGPEHCAPEGSRWQVLQSGELPPELVAALYRDCAAVLFPSQHEGFGFPLLHAAANGKRVIACDTASTRELTRAFGLDAHVRTFKTFEAIPGLIRQAMAEAPPAPLAGGRTWDDAARETAAFLDSILATPVDHARLERRFREMLALERTQAETDALWVQGSVRPEPPRSRLGTLLRRALRPLR